MIERQGELAAAREIVSLVRVGNVAIASSPDFSQITSKRPPAMA